MTAQNRTDPGTPVPVSQHRPSAAQRADPGAAAAGADGSAQRVRRALLATSLVAAPLLIAVSKFVAPTVDFTDPSNVVAVAAAEPGRWQVYELMAMFGTLLLLPAVLAAAELVRHRRPGLALAAVLVAGSGAVVLGGLFLRTWSLAAAEGVDPEALATFWEQSDQLSGFVAVGPFVFLLPIGMIVLAVGLWRSRAVPVWVAALLAVSFLALFFSSDQTAKVAGIVTLVPFTALAVAYMSGGASRAPVVVPRNETVEVRSPVD
jgi:hypothetical protein